MSVALFKTVQSAKVGLPIADGNEWNTGGYGQQNPFNPATHWSATPGSHHPSNFEPFESYYGAGYQPIRETSIAPTVVNPTPNTLVIQDPAINNDLQTVIPTPVNEKPITSFIDWIEAHDVIGGAIVTGFVGIGLYLLIGKK